MELSELVREVERTPDPAATARIERARTTVMQAIAAPRKKRSRSRWVWGSTAAGTLAAGAVAATVIFAGTVSPFTAQPASADAVAVLNDAAGTVMTGTDPVVAPGQYLRVRETYELVDLWDADAGGGYGYVASPVSESEGAVHQRSIRDMYIPGDRGGDWILDDRQVNEVLNVYGDPQARVDYDAMLDEFPEGASPQDPAGLRALPRGEPGERESWDPFRDEYDSMPRDPKLLLEWYRDRLGATPGDDWTVFQAMGPFLSTDAMPADLRAASLQTLALLGGVEIARVDGSVTTLKLESPIDFRGGNGDLVVSELDIDTSTGRIVGGREVYPHRSTEMLPEGIPWVSWTVQLEVVDEAPQP